MVWVGGSMGVGIVESADIENTSSIIFFKAITFTLYFLITLS